MYSNKRFSSFPGIGTLTIQIHRQGFGGNLAFSHHETDSKGHEREPTTGQGVIESDPRIINRIVGFCLSKRD